MVNDKEDVVRDSEGEKSIYNGISSGTEEVTAITINMGSQANIMILSENLRTSKLMFSRKSVNQEGILIIK